MSGARVFVSYSHANSSQRDELIGCLKPLEKDGAIKVWWDDLIRPGQRWREVLQEELRKADIAVLLVTSEFLDSQYCRELEVEVLRQRSTRSKLVLLPVICDATETWKKQPWIAEVQVVLACERHDEAWTRVAEAVRREAKRLGPRPDDGAVSLERLLEELPGGNREPFFGRKDRLEFLDAAFGNPSIGVVTYYAFGGVGKSALIRHWLTNNAPREGVRFVGCSFFDQGTREHAGTSDQFIVRALRDLGDAAPSGGELWKRGRRLAELVTEEPTVLVLDGLEPLQFGPGDSDRAGQLKDAGVRELLAALTERPGRSLCIVTTRLALTDPSLETSHLRQTELDVLSVE